MIEALLREMPEFTLRYYEGQFEVLDLEDLDTVATGKTAQDALQNAKPKWEKFYG